MGAAIGSFFNGPDSPDIHPSSSPEPPAKDAEEKQTHEFYVCFRDSLSLLTHSKKFRELGIVMIPTPEMKGCADMCRVVSTSAWLKSYQRDNLDLIFFNRIDMQFQVRPYYEGPPTSDKTIRDIFEEKKEKKTPPPKPGKLLFPDKFFTEAGMRVWGEFLGTADIVRLYEFKGESWIVFTQDGLPLRLMDTERVVYDIDYMDSTSVFFRSSCLHVQMELVMEKPDTELHRLWWDDEDPGWQSEIVHEVHVSTNDLVI